VALLVTAIFSIALSEPPAASQTSQDVLSANIDPTVPPGEDFFHYANGAWFKRNPIPADQTRWGIGNLVSQELYEQLRRISEEAAAKKAARGSAEQLIGDVWATGMDAATINAHGLTTLQPDLERIDQIGSVDDLMDVVATLHRRNMLSDNYFTRQRVLFDDGVDYDQNDSSRWTYFLSPGGLSMGRPIYAALDPGSVTLRDAFRDYLFKTFVRLGRDSGQAKASAAAVYDLEARLATGTEQGRDTRRIEVNELRQLVPLIDWDRYFRRVGVSRIDSVAVRQPRFFQALDALLRATSLEDWKDYLRFWLIKTHAPFVDDATFGEFFAYKSAFTGQREPPPRWWRVVWQERNWLGVPLGTLVDAQYWSKSWLARYRAIGESLRQAFRERIAHADWLSASTKDKTLLKLARLKITIGPPEKSVDFVTMALQRDSYVLNMIRSAEWFHDVETRRLNTPVDKTDGDLHPSAGAGDAQYDDSRNEVFVPSPTIVPGLRDDELDDAFVYGSTVLGHEIAHAFDSDGRQYDADGNKVAWWTDKDVAAFEARTQAVIDQYSAVMPLEGLHIDGRRSLRENLADLVGLRLALDAFKRTDEFKRNARVGGSTPLQRFFLAYAYSHMSQVRREALATRLRNDSSYAPDRERVNEVVLNIPEFYEAFGVKAGDRMYRPENVRVSVW